MVKSRFKTFDRLAQLLLFMNETDSYDVDKWDASFKLETANLLL